jgi:predicted nucleotidyltransferase
MSAFIDQHRQAIADLCRQFGVRKLELFGSCASEQFDPARSDVDFFYEFDSDPSSLADRFFGLLEGLERVLGRKVDLVSSSDVSNPFFLRVANQHRVTLYAA